ncbi:hypothetical protein KIPB_001616 [Kipferlia bialata]|uniref:Uncharacterized protein n=1 Tax=Kipferlia bialata TaxID=797122 RepID=A0A391NJM5_9EUKA|nr:hypothetical protein KIPB_001616 [Kipferlia bialata]|eukprot:g1616.t1
MPPRILFENSAPPTSVLLPSQSVGVPSSPLHPPHRDHTPTPSQNRSDTVEAQGGMQYQEWQRPSRQPESVRLQGTTMAGNRFLQGHYESCVSHLASILSPCSAQTPRYDAVSQNIVSRLLGSPKLDSDNFSSTIRETLQIPGQHRPPAAHYKYDMYGSRGGTVPADTHRPSVPASAPAVAPYAAMSHMSHMSQMPQMPPPSSRCDTPTRQADPAYALTYALTYDMTYDMTLGTSRWDGRQASVPGSVAAVSQVQPIPYTTQGSHGPLPALGGETGLPPAAFRTLERASVRHRELAKALLAHRSSSLTPRGHVHGLGEGVSTAQDVPPHLSQPGGEGTRYVPSVTDTLSQGVTGTDPTESSPHASASASGLSDRGVGMQSLTEAAPGLPPAMPRGHRGVPVSVRQSASHPTRGPSPGGSRPSASGPVPGLHTLLAMPMNDENRGRGMGGIHTAPSSALSRPPLGIDTGTVHTSSQDGEEHPRNAQGQRTVHAFKDTRPAPLSATYGGPYTEREREGWSGGATYSDTSRGAEMGLSLQGPNSPARVPKSLMYTAPPSHSHQDGTFDRGMSLGLTGHRESARLVKSLDLSHFVVG